MAILVEHLRSTDRRLAAEDGLSHGTALHESAAMNEAESKALREFIDRVTDSLEYTPRSDFRNMSPSIKT